MFVIYSSGLSHWYIGFVRCRKMALAINEDNFEGFKKLKMDRPTATSLHTNSDVEYFHCTL